MLVRLQCQGKMEDQWVQWLSAPLVLQQAKKPLSTARVVHHKVALAEPLALHHVVLLTTAVAEKLCIAV